MFTRLSTDLFVLLVALTFGAMLSGHATAQTPQTATANQTQRPNVLLISVDDLRPEINSFGAKHIISPHIDRLADEGRVFTRHYVSSAACGPSRISLLKGRRNHRGWGGFSGYRELGKETEEATSFVHLFRKNGYKTVGIGKISHLPGGVTDPEQTKQQMPYTWDRNYAPVGDWIDPWRAFFGYAHGRYRTYGYGRPKEGRMPTFEMADVPDTGYPDGLNAESAVKELHKLAKGDQPFFLAVGFYKPHLPHNAPKKYWDLYDRSKIGLPSNYHPAANIDPKISLLPSLELTTHYEWASGRGKVSVEEAIRQRHAYFACVSYIDAQIGKVMDAYRQLGLDKNTIVILWSDHGWHLGEQGIFCKATQFEVATRSPLIIKTPHMVKPGLPTKGIVETIDLYPTLVDLCQLKGTPIEPLEGHSLLPLLTNPYHLGKTGAISGYRGGITLRTDHYRLVYWPKHKQIELYNHLTDPDETVNVAAKFPDLTAQLMKQLKDRAIKMQ